MPVSREDSTLICAELILPRNQEEKEGIYLVAII